MAEARTSDLEPAPVLLLCSRALLSAPSGSTTAARPCGIRTTVPRAMLGARRRSWASMETSQASRPTRVYLVSSSWASPILSSVRLGVQDWISLPVLCGRLAAAVGFSQLNTCKTLTSSRLQLPIAKLVTLLRTKLGKNTAIGTVNFPSPRPSNAVSDFLKSADVDFQATDASLALKFSITTTLIATAFALPYSTVLNFKQGQATVRFYYVGQRTGLDF